MESIEFLKKFRPGGPWPLTFIVPDGRVTTTTFFDDRLDQMEEAVELRTGHENIYFQVNSSGEKNLTKKAKKDDIVEAEWLHVDVDPQTTDAKLFDAERANILKTLKEFNPTPTLIIDSGGGYQAFWHLDKPVKVDGGDWTEFESYNRWLEMELGGDHCHNVDRIMRLPGTINIPNAKKRAKGREERETKVVHWDDKLRYDLSNFQKAPKIDGGTKADGGRVAVSLSGNLPRLDDVGPELKAVATEGEFHPSVPMLIVNGSDVEDGNRWNGDRSRATFYVVCELVRAGVPDDYIAAVLLDSTLGISAHTLDQGNPEGYVVRQIQRAKEALDGPQFATDKNGVPIRASFHNAVEALKHLGVHIWFDTFAGVAMVEGHAIQDFAGPVTDAAMVDLRRLIREEFRLEVGKENLRDAFDEIAQQKRRDPVADYLRGLVWDGEARLDHWLEKTFGVPDDEYHRTVARVVISGMVRRVLHPGCKFDLMLVLEGRQGLFKSESFKVLAGEDRFSDAAIFAKDSGRDRGELLEGCWINESAELDGMSKREVGDVRNFVTQTFDKYRPAYAHHVVRVPRRGILVGSTNDSHWHRDETGGRRFLPVKVAQKGDLDWLRENRDHLFAEAMARRDEKVWLEGEAERVQEAAMKDRLLDHAWDDLLENMPPEEWSDGFAKFSSMYIMKRVLQLSDAVIAQPATARTLAARMKALGYEKASLRFSGVTDWRSSVTSRGYRRPSPMPRGEIPI